MNHEHILLVEDNYDLACSLIESLEEAGFEVDYAADGAHAMRLIEAARPPFDALILDVDIPRINGLAVCSRARALGFAAPIVMLTALSSPDDVVRGLENGSDDYVVKPFEVRVLVARLRAALRRSRGTAPGQGQLSRGGITLDSLDLKLTLAGGTTLALTPIQAKLLDALLRQAPRVVTREQLERAVWGDQERPTADALRVHIYQLRQLIDRPLDGKLICTQGKQGYYMDIAP